MFKESIVVIEYDVELEFGMENGCKYLRFFRFMVYVL